MCIGLLKYIILHASHSQDLHAVIHGAIKYYCIFCKDTDDFNFLTDFVINLSNV